jgi:uncharacterized repeat protein (TIGR03803 family)
MTPTLTTLVGFNDANGAFPDGDLIADVNGDLFGTSSGGGANGDFGTVFEIAKTAGGYARTPTTLVSFNDANGASPEGSLIADANGDLFGTTADGGANGDFGTVFEIAKTAGGYASTPITLVSFNDDDGESPSGSLIVEANGDLFGTSIQGGANDVGTVFEIAKTAGGYAGTPTTLVSFDDANGAFPNGSLIADADGDLFGTTLDGGANDDGVVFEIAKTAGGYAGTPTTLVSFNGTNGFLPGGSLITDANGDLFGTTTGLDPTTGDPLTDCTVFEIVETGAGYASTPTTLVSFNGTNGETPFGSLIADSHGNLVGTTDSGGVNHDGTVFEITGSGFALTRTAPTLTMLAGFSGGINGEEPEGGLIADANGDLFGTTSADGAFGGGTVFELAKTAGGYASAPTTLASFDVTTGETPMAGLIADANGDLFGTASAGGAGNAGTVFEIAKTAGRYASSPTTLVSFDSGGGSFPHGADPLGSLIADADGDLFGTTLGGGADHFGTVFEIVKTAGGYASTPTTLVSFNEADGLPKGSLIADANGDLFGADSSVFEIVKTPTGYANTPTILASGGSAAGLIADANGDLFGTTEFGGPGGFGTVFEIVKTPTGYASTPITLANIGSSGNLIADANGDLFGTNQTIGASGEGSVFEIVRTAAGYASTPTIVASFDSADGRNPVAGLIADANGNLFGTTPSGGPSFELNGGTVFEITNSGFATTASVTPPATITANILWQNTSSGQASIWEMDGSALVGGGPMTPNPGPSFHAVGTGDFNKDGHSDILWQNTSTGQASIWEMNGSTLIGGGPVTPNPGPAFRAVGTGDFNGDGFSDILWQNTSSGQASIWEMNGNTLMGGGLVTPNPGPSFRAVGTGDFNHDGFSDILWQNTSTGQVSIWEMHGATLVGGGPVTPNPGTAWKAIGTGDFNHDGFADILFQNKNTGQVSVWEMNGTSLIGGGPVSANPGLSWHAIGTGAGGSDILLQNTSGQTSIWDMSGNTITGGGPVSPNPGPTFRAVGLT